MYRFMVLAQYSITRILCQNVKKGPGNGTGFRYLTASNRKPIISWLWYNTQRIIILNNNRTMDFLVIIYYSVNVLVRQVRIEDRNRTGLAIIDTTGYVEVSHSFFKRLHHFVRWAGHVYRFHLLSSLYGWWV